MATVPMNVRFSNHAISTLAVAVAVSDTTIYLEAGDGALFPTLAGTQYFYLTLEDADNSTNYEVVKVTARATDTLTVTRAQDNTSARAFAIGAKAQLRLPNIAITDMLARDRVHHVDDYGASPGGTGAANLAGINAAVAAALAGTNGTNIVAFSNGEYEVSDTINILMNDGDINSHTIELIGRGSSGDDATVITVASGKSGFFFSSLASYGSNGSEVGIHVKGFNFIGAGGAATSALIFGAVGGQMDCFGKNAIEDVTSYGFSLHCDIKNTRHLAFTNCAFRGADIGGVTNATNPQSLKVSMETGFTCGDHTFINCEFSTINDSDTSRRCVELVNNASTSGGTGYLAGLKFEGCNFYYGFYALYAHINDSAVTITGPIQDIFINNCQFDGGGVANDSVVGLYFLNNSLSGGTCVSNWRNIKINDCYIFNYRNAAVFASQAANSNGGGVQYINFTNNYIYNAINVGARFTSCWNVICAENNLRHCGNSGTNLEAFNCQSVIDIVCSNNVHTADGSASNLYYFLSLDSSCKNITALGNVAHLKEAASTLMNDSTTGTYKNYAANKAYWRSGSTITEISVPAYINNELFSGGGQWTAVGAGNIYRDSYVHIGGTGDPAYKLTVTGTARVSGIFSTAVDAVINTAHAGIGGTAVATNLCFGADALQANTTGYRNVAVGYHAADSVTTGYENIAVGAEALSSTTNSYQNVAIGPYALTTGTGAMYYNNAIGYYAMGRCATNSQANVAIGVNSMYGAVGATPSSNVAVGHSPMYAISTGANNVAVGATAMYSVTTGSQNVGIGNQALYGNTLTGTGNVAVGANALLAMSTGTYNTAIGWGAGWASSSSNYNSWVDANCTFIGSYASRENTVATGTSLSNAMALGYNAKVDASNTVVLGNSSVTATTLRGTITGGTFSGTGNNGFLGAVASSASAPSYSFLTDTNTGMYRVTADELGFTTGGTARGRFTSAGLIVPLAVEATNLTLTIGGGGQITFQDGSTMNSAALGSASAVSAVGDANITGDSDSSGVGDINLISGATTVATVHPTSFGTTWYYGVWGKGATLGHHVEAYGAVGDGSTDDRTAIQNAFNAAVAGTNGSNTVVFGAKTYRISDVVYVTMSADTINIKGEGCSGANATWIEVDNSKVGFRFDTAAALNDAASRNGITIRDIGFTGVTPTTAIQLGITGTQLDSLSNIVIENVFTENFAIAIDIINTRKVVMRNVVLRGVDVASSISLKVKVEATFFSGDMMFDACEFSTKAGTGSTAKAVYIENASSAEIAALNFTDCFFYYGEKGSFYAYNTSTGAIRDITFQGCQFDFDGTQNSEAAIYIDQTHASGSIRGITVDSCEMYSFATGVYIVAQTGTARNIHVVNCQIENPIAKAVLVQGAYGIVINNNTFYNCGDGTASGTVIYISLSESIAIVGNIHNAKPAGATSNAAYLLTADTCGYVTTSSNTLHMKSGGAIAAYASTATYIETANWTFT